MTANASKENKNALEGIKNITLEYYADINTIMRESITYLMQIEFVIFRAGAVESGYLLSMQETSQQQIIVDGVQQGGVIVEASTFNETT